MADSTAKTSAASPKSTEVPKLYEGVIIAHPDVSTDLQKDLFKKYQAIINQFQGKIHLLDTWGKRTLTNPIAKNKKGVYFHTMFEAQPAAIAELERTMRINDRVLRYLHIKLDERIPASKHLEKYRLQLAETSNREKEREAKAQARKAAAAAAMG